MEESEIDYGSFVIPGPLWHVSDAEGGYGTGTLSSGVPFVALFTDSDLAERFIGRSGLAGSMAVELPTDHDLAHFLYAIHEEFYERIAIDPEPGRPTRHSTTFGYFRFVCGRIGPQ